MNSGAPAGSDATGVAPRAPPSLRFLEGGGAMGGHIRAHDWEATELGPPHTWPGPLRTTLRMMLTTQHPVFIFWGPRHRCFYNDAYAHSLGPERHPQILGAEGRPAWEEIWPAIGPQIEQVMSGGGATWHENQLVPITRDGALQDVYWTYSYTPIDDEAAPLGVGGVLVLVTETTKAMTLRRQLEAADTRWRSLFAQTPGFVCILDGPEHRFQFANPRYQALLGHRPLIDLSVREAVPEAVEQGFVAMLDTVYGQNVARTGTSVPLQLRSPVDGSVIDVFLDFVYQPIVGDDGEVHGIFVQGSDVTDRVRSHTALVANEARYRALAENLPGGAVFVVDADLRYVMASGEALVVAGFDSASLIGRSVADFLGPERAPAHEANYRRALAGEPFEITHDGHGRSFLTRGVPLRDADGAVTGVLAASYDLTSLRATEAKLQKAMTKLHGVLASAEVGLWTLDLATNMVEQDANIARLYGLPPDEVCSAEVHWERIVAEDRPVVSDAVHAALVSGTFYVREYRVHASDGKPRWLAGRGAIARDAAGQPVSLTGLCMDISDLKAMEEALRTSDRQKDEFLAMLAHELRNPLAPIMSASELLVRTGDPVGRAAAAVIQRQARQMARLVDDLLDVSRITQQKIDISASLLLVADIVNGAVEAVQPLLNARNHRVTIVSAGVPRVWGDSVRLVQCVVNVLTNAAKYTPPGGDIRLETHVEGAEVVLRITDNGSGIAQELIPYVFDLFVQGSRSLDRSQGGLGIGLSLVQRLIHLHGGRVSVTSPGPGLGASFVLCLPQYTGAAENNNRPDDQRMRPLRILVVDDNEDAAQSLCALLAMDGHAVSASFSGSAALEQMERDPPQVVLLDIGLPGMDGYEVAHRVRASPMSAGVRLIALTGYGQDDDKQRALSSGFDDYLIKPIQYERLHEALIAITQD